MNQPCLFDTMSEEAFLQKYLSFLEMSKKPKTLIEASKSYLVSDDFREAVERLKNGTFAFSAPRLIKLFDTHYQKYRNIYVYPQRDRLLMRIILFELHRYDNHFSPCVQTGLRIFTPWEKTLYDVTKYGQLYYFTTDIHKCNDSIDGEILKAKIMEFCRDDIALSRFLCAFIDDDRCIRNGALCHDRAAVPTGSPLSWYLVNIYLRELDAAIEPQADFYARLTDRIAIGAFDPEKLARLRDEALAIIARNGLRTNAADTLFLRPGETLAFNGMSVTGSAIHLDDKLINTIKKRIRVFAVGLSKQTASCDAHLRGVIAVYAFDKLECIKHLQNTFVSTTDPSAYREIDRVVQNCLREIITGKKDSKKYACTYADLKALGYKTLTNRYYEFIKKRKSACLMNKNNTDGERR